MDTIWEEKEKRKRRNIYIYIYKTYIYIYIRRGECGGGLAGYVETQAIKKI